MSDPFLRPFIFGVVACAVAAAIVVLAAVELGLVPANADAKPSKLEEWAAKTSLRATINRETDRKAPNPLRPSDESLDAGIDLYATNCGICHGTSDGKKSLIAQGFSIEAPQLAKDGVERDPPTRVYWEVEHGIRFTAMPAFSTRLTEKQMWQVALFLQKMDALPAEPDTRWHALPTSAKLVQVPAK